MKIKLVSDSACNIFEFEGADFVSVPMKIIAGDSVFIDTPDLDVKEMQEYLRKYKGKSNTGHPGFRDWQRAFGDADVVYGVTVTGKLSGSYNAALLAAEEYMEEHPGRKVYILDSESTGPVMEMMLEKFRELSRSGKSFEEVQEYMKDYFKTVHCWWSLENVHNFVATGRLHAAAAFIIKIFGINIVGTTEGGELIPTYKCRGTGKSVSKVYESMISEGYKGGKVRISHSFNKEAVTQLTKLIHNDYPDADVKARLNCGLCGYYVEKGGFMVGFEEKR